MLKNKRNQQAEQRNAIVKGIALMSQIAFIIIACLFVGVFIGNWLDKLFDTSPLFILVFSFLGMGASFKALYDFFKKM